MPEAAPAPVLFAHRIRPGRVLAVILLVEAVLLIAYIVSAIFVMGGQVDSPLRTELVRIVDMNHEVSIPKWWEQGLMLVAALLLVQIGIVVRRVGDRNWLWWMALAVVFFAVSLDETAAIHEISAEPVQRITGITSGIWAAGWIYPVAVLLIIAIVVFLRFYLRLPRDTKLLFALALAIFVIGAVGMEFFQWWLTGPVVVVNGWLLAYISWGTEEVLEVVGVAVFLYALLRYVRDHLPRDPLTVAA